MADSLDDLFADANKFDPFGPYRRREMKVEVVNGEERVVQITHIESQISGVLNIIDEVRFLCQGCGIEWVSPGFDGFSKTGGKILFPKCSRKAVLKALLKPLWSPFIKFDGNK
jgi:hypothetical protein